MPKPYIKNIKSFLPVEAEITMMIIGDFFNFMCVYGYNLIINRCLYFIFLRGVG
jgi:hypothetical protein